MPSTLTKLGACDIDLLGNKVRNTSHVFLGLSLCSSILQK